MEATWWVKEQGSSQSPRKGIASALPSCVLVHWSRPLWRCHSSAAWKGKRIENRRHRMTGAIRKGNAWRLHTGAPTAVEKGHDHPSKPRHRFGTPLREDLPLHSWYTSDQMKAETRTDHDFEMKMHHSSPAALKETLQEDQKCPY